MTHELFVPALPDPELGVSVLGARPTGVQDLVELLVSGSCSQAGARVSPSVVSDSFPPVNCSPPGSSVPGISQARILEWVAMPSSRGSSPPRD